MVPMAILIPNKTLETLVQAYLQHIYATFGGSFTLITDNWKYLENELFQKVASNSSKSPFFFLFGRDTLTSPRKILSPTIRYIKDKKVPLTSYPWGMPLQWQAKVSLLADRHLTMNKPLQHPLTYSKLGILYMLKTFPSMWDAKWEYEFRVIKFSAPSSAVLESTLNGKSSNANIANLHFSNPLYLLETENVPINNWGKKQSF